MRPLDLAVELRGSRLDVDVLDAPVGHMPVEECLKLVSSVGTDRVNAKRELLDHVVDEIDCILLGVARVDLESGDSRRVINRGVLKPPDDPAVSLLQVEERDVDLNVMSGYLICVSMRVNRASADTAWEPVEPVSLEDSRDTGLRDPDVVVSLRDTVFARP